MTSAEQKAKLRRQIRERLDDLSSDERAQAAFSLHQQLDLLELEGPILGFLPLPDEIDLTGFLATRIDDLIAVPEVDWSSRTMRLRRLTGFSDHDLRTDRHGLRTPRDAEEIPVEILSTILVPGLAFDRRGQRLGRGGGFYDRLLAEVRLDVRILGVAFSEQIVEAVPFEPWDRRVQRIITPTGVLAGGS